MPRRVSRARARGARDLREQLADAVAWARETECRVARGSRWRRADPRSGLARRTIGPWRRIPEHVVRGLSEPEEASQILVAEVEAFAPDLILDQNLGAVLPEAVRAIAVGPAYSSASMRLCCSRPTSTSRSTTSLISSFQPTVVELQRRGLHAELSLLGFDPEVLTAFDSVGVQRYGPPSSEAWHPSTAPGGTSLETLASSFPTFGSGRPTRCRTPRSCAPGTWESSGAEECSTSFGRRGPR